MTALDTNVLIYACDTSDPKKQERALSLIASARDGVLPWQVACEFVAASRKLAAQGFGSREAWTRLSELMALFPLILPTANALTRARQLQLDQRVAFWDAMLIAACLDSGVVRLFSEDLPGRSIEGLEIVDPFARDSSA